MGWYVGAKSATTLPTASAVLAWLRRAARSGREAVPRTILAAGTLESFPFI